MSRAARKATDVDVTVASSKEITRRLLEHRHLGVTTRTFDELTDEERWRFGIKSDWEREKTDG